MSSPDPARRNPEQDSDGNRYSLAFHDINPLAAIHVLVIPKGRYVSWDDFTAKASNAKSAISSALWERWRGRPTHRHPGLSGAQQHRQTGRGGKCPHFHVHVFGRQPTGTDAGKIATEGPRIPEDCNETKQLGSAPNKPSHKGISAECRSQGTARAHHVAQGRRPNSASRD